jgi:hypothetical protein
MLAPIIPVTLNWPKCTGSCPAIPPNAKPLPDGSYSYTIMGSLTYRFLRFGGFLSAFGPYVIQIPRIPRVFGLGPLWIVILPLCVAMIAGFVAAFLAPKQKTSNEPPWYNR